jgi:exodeoxyribonuclease VII large subunit
VSDQDQRILSVTDYLEMVNMTLNEVYGKGFPCWIRGEIKKITAPKHIYIDLVDEQGSALSVKCWQSTWATIKPATDLQIGSVITFRATADIYKARGSFSVTMTHLRVESDEGDADKKRQELITRLRAEGVLRPEDYEPGPLPALPLRVGLVASPGTEGCNDFLGQLEKSGMAFTVVLVPALVQGDLAAAAVARGIAELQAAEVDVIAVVRGGGSRTDLACFDDERIARAIAQSTPPVLTGIGHTGDVSVADLAAYRFFSTPTAVGTALGRTAQATYERRVLAPADRLGVAARAVVEEATAYVESARRDVLSSARTKLAAEQAGLAHTRSTMWRSAEVLLDRSSRQLHATNDLLRAHDPQRRLQQGWSITTTLGGGVVRSVDDVRLGEDLRVRVADGTLDVAVTEREKKER